MPLSDCRRPSSVNRTEGPRPGLASGDGASALRFCVGEGPLQQRRGRFNAPFGG